MKNLAQGIRTHAVNKDTSALLQLATKLDAVGLTVEELAEINYAVNDADEVEGRGQLREKIEKLKQVLKEHAIYG